MNILLVTDSYPPEIRSASHLMQELAEELRRRGHKIYVVTSRPGYNLSDGADIGNLQKYSNENGIKVLRVKTLPHHMVNFIVRGIAQLTMPRLFLRQINKHIKNRIDVVILYSPPITLALVAAALKAKYNAKFLLNVQDIFPQNAIDLGILKNRLLIRFFENIEKKAYAAADQVVVHSQGNKKFLVSRKGIGEHKVHIMHNWVDVSLYAGAKKTGRFRQKYGLKNKFVFLFAGVMGPSQGLDLVIELAEQVKANSDICFLFVGDGTEKQKLQEMTRNYRLQNVVFAPFVPKEEYPELVKDVDVGLVSLTSKNKTPVVPGKILTYMAAGIPVVAFLQKESDGHRLVNQANCGFSMIYGDPQKAAELAVRIYTQRGTLKRLGRNGAKYALNIFSIKKAVEKLEGLFQNSIPDKSLSSLKSVS